METTVGPRDPYSLIGREMLSEQVTKLVFPDGNVYRYRAAVGESLADIAEVMKHLDGQLWSVHNPMDVGDDDQDHNLYISMWCKR